MQYINNTNNLISKQTRRFVQYAIYFAIAMIALQYTKADGIPHTLVKIVAYIYGISAVIAILLRYYYLHQLNKYMKELENQRKNYFKEKYYSDFFEEQTRRRQQFQQKFNDFYNDFVNEERKKYGGYSGGGFTQEQTKENNELDIYLKLMKLNRNSTEDEIKKRYRELAFKWHPDKWALDTIENQKIANRNFQLLNTAYETIKKYKNIK